MITKLEYEQYEQNHKNMWAWLTENPWYNKDDYFDRFPELYNQRLEDCCLCFACLVGGNNTGNNCNLCPLTSSCLSLFEKYCDNQEDYTYFWAIYYAQQIVNISWKPYKEWRKCCEKSE